MSDWPQQQGICQRSGFKFPRNQLVREWTGLLVHPRYADKRNPQDFVTGVPDRQAKVQPAPEAADTFQNSWDITPGDL